MYEIIVYTYSDAKKSFKAVDDTFALFIFNSLTEAMDAQQVILIDGLTGEFLKMWLNGKMEIE